MFTTRFAHAFCSDTIETFLHAEHVQCEVEADVRVFCAVLWNTMKPAFTVASASTHVDNFMTFISRCATELDLPQNDCEEMVALRRAAQECESPMSPVLKQIIRKTLDVRSPCQKIQLILCSRAALLDVKQDLALACVSVARLRYDGNGEEAPRHGAILLRMRRGKYLSSMRADRMNA